MTAELIGFNEVKALLEDIVKGNEDYVYEPPADSSDCQNWTRGVDENGNSRKVPSCIVGHVLSRVDLLDKVEQGSGVATWVQAHAAIGASLAYQPEQEVWGKFTDKALCLLSNTQSHQDTGPYEGKTWGESLSMALAEMPPRLDDQD